MAINFDIPLVIWGENPQREYGNPGAKSAKDQKNHDALRGQDASHWQSDTITAQDLIAYQHPSEKELGDKDVIYLSDFIPFDARLNRDKALKWGLTIRPDDELEGTGGYWNFEQLDDEIPIISHLLKYIKYGYGRATDHACRDIRWGYITRKEGFDLVNKYDGKFNPDYIKRYCKFVGITEEEFWRIADTWRN